MTIGVGDNDTAALTITQSGNLMVGSQSAPSNIKLDIATSPDSYGIAHRSGPVAIGTLVSSSPRAGWL